MLTTTERGYGAQHQAKREEWRPAVDRGEVDCHATVCLEEHDGYGRWIEPGTPWDLGHTPDRSRWTGPEHRRCNRSDGAVRRNEAHGWGSHRGSRHVDAADPEPVEALRFFE